jgi:hypothetical protein
VNESTPLAVLARLLASILSSLAASCWDSLDRLPFSGFDSLDPQAKSTTTEQTVRSFIEFPFLREQMLRGLAPVQVEIPRAEPGASPPLALEGAFSQRVRRSCRCLTR